MGPFCWLYGHTADWEVSMSLEIYWTNRLKELVKNCGGLLRGNSEELRTHGEGRAADVACAMCEVTDALLELALADPPSERGCLWTAANLFGSLLGNGLGDAIVAPAYRRAGMNRAAEEWSVLARYVRQTSQELQNSLETKKKRT
jgi:hypothetical protein